MKAATYTILGIFTAVLLTTNMADAQTSYDSVNWPTVKRKTIQSLAKGVMGRFLTLDENGALDTTLDSDVENSGTYWEIDTTYNIRFVRGYMTRVIRNRGNSVYNGHGLQTDGNLGVSVSGREPLSGNGNRWIVQYTGFYNGYQSFHIQASDMSFLTIDPTTGELTLQRKLSPGAHWRVRESSTLPTDNIR
ncbi:MAG: hypothetical protein ACI9HK_006209 [Pirellulaceae bacterium]|jgi:hypothetical protein